MQLYSEKRSIMNKLIGLLTCLCFSTNLAVAQNKDASSIIKFGLFADTQYADCPSQNTRYYREALQKLDTCIEYFNRQEVQFTINLGDITDRKNSDLEVINIIRKTKCSSVLKQNVLFYKTKRTSVNLFSYPNWHKKAPKKYVFFGAFYCSVFWLSHQKSLTLNKYIIFGFNAILIPLKRRYIIPPESWARHRLYSIMSVYVAL